MAPRWKGKGAEAKALAEPISETVSKLQSSLIESEATGLLSGCNLLLAVEAEKAELLDRACFGRTLVTAEKDKQWYQLSLEEAFYLFHTLKCIKILGQDGCFCNDEDIWQYIRSKKEIFPVSYKAYSHLRMKNWIVRSGLQYGADFVAYRHHPSLVHSEYAVLIRPDDDMTDRLRIWSDVHCAVRLCGSVAKTLLVLYINKNGHGYDSLSCLENYAVEEQTITRWSPEQCREDRKACQN